MHKCVRCGRAAASLQEINDGCQCGSKVFVFDKEVVCSIAGEEAHSSGANGAQESRAPAEAGGWGATIVTLR